MVALVRPDLSQISAWEMEIVEDVMEWMRPMTANQISDLSHESVGWEVARLGERIVFATALIPKRPRGLSAKEQERAVSDPVAAPWFRRERRFLTTHFEGDRMTTLAVMLGLWAIGATFWALEERSYQGVLREDRNYWYAMYVKATPDIRCKVASEETKE